MQPTQFVWSHAIKSSHLFWLVNYQNIKITYRCQREVQMVIQLGFIKRFAVSVRKDVCHIEGRKCVLNERTRIIDKAKSLRERPRTFLRNRALFRFNYKKLLVS